MIRPSGSVKYSSGVPSLAADASLGASVSCGANFYTHCSGGWSVTRSSHHRRGRRGRSLCAHSALTRIAPLSKSITQRFEGLRHGIIRLTSSRTGALGCCQRKRVGVFSGVTASPPHSDVSGIGVGLDDKNDYRGFSRSVDGMPLRGPGPPGRHSGRRRAESMCRRHAG
jgi:hypothetical protein